MIERVEIRNWQSLRSVDLTLGRLTVILGESSSGKTALMRALRALASNVRGAGSITRGAKSTAVTVNTGEHKVTLERTESSGLYRIVNVTTGAEEVFSKLGGAVPDAVTQALRILPVPTGGVSINFAGQFDRPFLLDDSGANVARVLGELTNVDRIFSAVREANKRRAAQASVLRTRESDLEDLRTRAATFRDLPAKLAACDAAEQTAERAAELASQVDRLRNATEALAVAEGVLARSSVLPEVPADTAVLDAQARMASFRTLLRSLTTANNAAATASAQADQFAQEEAVLEQQLHDRLVAAGTCPTCGQSTESC